MGSALGQSRPGSAFRSSLQPESGILGGQEGREIAVAERSFSPIASLFFQVLFNQPAINHGNGNGVRRGQVEHNSQMCHAGR